MPRDFLQSGVPQAHTTTRQRLTSLLDLPKLYRTIDADPAIVGAAVVHIGSDYQVTVLREFVPLCSIRPKRVMLREMTGPVRTAEEYAQLAASSPRESQVWKEASGVVSSCGGAVIGIIIAKAGIAAAPFSAGTSLALSYVALAGTAASGVQCLNSLWRTYNEFVNPAENDYYDSLGWYQAMTVALDGISLVGAGSTTFATVKTIMAIKHSTGREVTDVLRHMSRQERAKLTSEVLRLKNPHHPSAMVRLKQLSGQLPRRFSNSQIRLSIMTQIQDQIGATLAVTGSTLSGNVNHVIVALYEEFDSHEI
ncbi:MULTISPECIES: NAD synthetase [unclassified Pseudomonas]|uniref:NAD synthetase n=1 Tax=unclassified Pseudomonas TaxID=196821 RepID=UPI0008E91C98|nr:MULTISPECIES: NAD synthetase [unclassified Pseudomonas]PMV26524.1 NAD synthetase [Pseudomonas sp. FW305-3-2-15-C-TSA2]PMV31895.1 NAD synthetase [Pseudomonas sp. DP16D-L5]PMV41308.1 NAD synthetase [Pseudomonas sp. FW305-3-2-15-A-LB2]PMV48063.1 NAD synthetase [Pseudomonas sp. FW305-3-2-15-C-R2A1]PMV54520.1 NAD synthetase [Pseudomonas sp. FW305-3-2-15-C-LB1]